MMRHHPDSQRSGARPVWLSRRNPADAALMAEIIGQRGMAPTAQAVARLLPAATMWDLGPGR
jgi:hypothetical protein